MTYSYQHEATIFTHPIDTVKLRLQIQGISANNEVKYNGLFSGLARVAREEGIVGLYGGLSPAILRAATYSATRLGMYEPLRTIFTEKAGQTEPSFGVKLSAAVCSGALGSFQSCFTLQLSTSKLSIITYMLICDMYWSFSLIVNLFF